MYRGTKDFSICIDCYAPMKGAQGVGKGGELLGCFRKQLQERDES